jgi:hypothetical protein
MLLDIGFKEWSAVIDALALGQQSIIIRTYFPTHSRFILYPTFTFYRNKRKNFELFGKAFQQPYRKQAWESGEQTYLRAHQDNVVDIKFYAEVTNVYVLPSGSSLQNLEEFFIWSADHIRSYELRANAKSLYIWVVRVYRLQNPLVVDRVARGGPPSFFRQCPPATTENSIPILSQPIYKLIQKSIPAKDPSIIRVR